MITKSVSPMATRWSASHVAVTVLSSCHEVLFAHVVLAFRTSGSSAHTATCVRVCQKQTASAGISVIRDRLIFPEMKSRFLLPVHGSTCCGRKPKAPLSSLHVRTWRLAKVAVAMEGGHMKLTLPPRNKDSESLVLAMAGEGGAGTSWHTAGDMQP